MIHIKRGVTKHSRHKALLKRAKGFRGRSNNTFRIAHQKVIRSEKYIYRDRRQKKSNIRRLWISLLNNFLKRNVGYTYNQFIYTINIIDIKINRKSLFDLLKIDNSIEFLSLKNHAVLDIFLKIKIYIFYKQRQLTIKDIFNTTIQEELFIWNFLIKNIDNISLKSNDILYQVNWPIVKNNKKNQKDLILTHIL